MVTHLGNLDGGLDLRAGGQQALRRGLLIGRLVRAATCSRAAWIMLDMVLSPFRFISVPRKPAAARDSHCLMAGPFSRTWMRNRFWPASAWSISMA